MGRKQSVRTCLACRKRELKETLCRFVCNEGRIVFDEEHKLPGRGAYVHRDRECLARVSNTKVWSRALKKVVTDVGDIQHLQ